ncbi:MAG: CsgG/HfaB family protein, partial [Planctomycetia bacterium]|nr:CsgG/HfaB family protein [Planctomycetia bacterium]
SAGDAGGPPRPQAKVRTLTVLNFANRHPGDDWDWLAKGLADMLITDLSATSRLQLVERERMQALFAEMRLAEAGLVDEKTAAKFGKTIKADLALFGSYLVEEGNIQIEAHIVEVRTGALRRVEFVKGPAEDVLKLEKQLAEQVVKRLDIPLRPAERKRLLRFRTLKVDAAAAYYRAMDVFDNGDYPAALGLFRRATRHDAEFDKARFQVAQMYLNLGEPQHAVVEFERVAASLKESRYPAAAAYLCAKIRDERLALPAGDDYMVVVNNFPGTIAAVLAAYEAGKHYERSGEYLRASDAYAAVDEGIDACLDRQLLPVGFVGYANMFDPLLNIKKMGDLKWIRAASRERYNGIACRLNLQGKKPRTIPSHVLYFTRENNTIENIRPQEGTPPETYSRRNLGGTGQMFVSYVLLPPRGMVFESLRVRTRAGPRFSSFGPRYFFPEDAPQSSFFFTRPWGTWFNTSERHKAYMAAGGTRAFSERRSVIFREPGEQIVELKLPPNCRSVQMRLWRGRQVWIHQLSVEATMKPDTESAREPAELAAFFRLSDGPKPVHGMCPFYDGQGNLRLVFGDMDILNAHK